MFDMLKATVQNGIPDTVGQLLIVNHIPMKYRFYYLTNNNYDKIINKLLIRKFLLILLTLS